MKPLGIKTENISVDFAEGDTIAVVAGVWKDTIGAVQKMDYNKQTATINVELFGRLKIYTNEEVRARKDILLEITAR